MNTLKMAAVSLATGFVATLYTGLVNTTPGGLVGAVWYGWPESWLKYLVIAPQYSPWKVTHTNLAIDVIVWAVIAFIIWAIIAMGAKRR